MKFERLDGLQGRPSNYVGAVGKEDAFVAVEVPKQGEFVSIVSLAGGTSGVVARRLGRIPPFLPVAFVEHYLVAIGSDGEIPDWWNAGFRTPGVTVVFQVAAVDHGADETTETARAFESQGWTVYRGRSDPSDL